MTDWMPDSSNEELVWLKSSHSGGEADKTDCVEVAFLPRGAGAAVRDSKDPEGGMFRLPPEGFRGLLASVQQHQVPPAE